MKVANGSKTVDETEQEIPIVTDVIVIGDVESNVDTPATNPEHKHTPERTHSANVPTTHSKVVAKTKKKSRIKLHTNLGREPYGIRCEHCQKETITIVQDRIGTGTIIATVLLALIFWPLCWLPFCMPSCKRTNHFCAHDSCRKKIGVTHACA